jgi:hypothetical protein
MAFLRRDPTEQILVAANFSETAVPTTLDLEHPGRWVDIGPGEPGTWVTGTALELPPYGFRWLATDGA